MNPETLERRDQATTAPPSYSRIPPSQPSSPVGISESVDEVKEAAGDQIRQAAADLKETGSEVLQTAKDAGTNLVSEQKEKIADKIDQYTKALQSACESLKQGEANPLVGPAGRASQHLQKASDYLRSRDGMDFLHDLGDLARRRPEIVFGGLFVAGLASVRFLKSSARDRRTAQQNNGIVTSQSSPAAYNPYAGTSSPSLRQPILNPNQLK